MKTFKEISWQDEEDREVGTINAKRQKHHGKMMRNQIATRQTMNANRNFFSNATGRRVDGDQEVCLINERRMVLRTVMMGKPENTSRCHVRASPMDKIYRKIITHREMRG